MEGIKCPICKAVNTNTAADDGDMVRCSCCKARFTVTRARRYNLLDKELDKVRSVRNEALLEDFIRKLENDRLLLVLKLSAQEIISRMGRT